MQQDPREDQSSGALQDTTSIPQNPNASTHLHKSESEWDIFHKVPNAVEIVKGLDRIPDGWALTPLQDKSPRRKNWQHEFPLSKQQIANLIQHGEQATSKAGNIYQRYWSGYGLRTGEVSGGLIAIDVDGPTAQPLLEAIANGNIPVTVSWTSGKPGRYQLLFRVPVQHRAALAQFNRAVVTQWDDAKSQHDDEGKPIELLEFRYNGCQSCLPPSRHPTTGNYGWINPPDTTEVAIAPEWLCNLLVDLATKEAKTKQERKQRAIDYAALKKEQKSGLVGDLVDFLNFEILPRLSVEQIYNDNHNFRQFGDTLKGSPTWRASSSGTSFHVWWDGTHWAWQDKAEGCGGGAVQYRWKLRGGSGTPKGKDFVDIVAELAHDAGLELPSNLVPKKIQTKLSKQEQAAAKAAAKQENVDHLLELIKKQSQLTGGETGKTFSARWLSDGINPKEILCCVNAIVGIKSAKGTGKTTLMVRVVEILKELGIPVVVISHRIKLCKFLAKLLNLPYRTNIQGRALPESGFVLCVDSFHSNGSLPININDDYWKNVCVIIDEAEQFTSHLLRASTEVKNNRQEILNNLAQLIRNLSQSIINKTEKIDGSEDSSEVQYYPKLILLDADLSDICTRFFTGIANSPYCSLQELENYQANHDWLTPAIFINEWTPDDEIKANCYFYTEQSPLVMRDFLMEHIATLASDGQSLIEQNKRIYINTQGAAHTSKHGVPCIAKEIQERLPHLKVLDINRQTLGFCDHAINSSENLDLNSIIKNYDIIVASPSLETGYSIDDLPASQFDSVWCFAPGVDSPKNALQGIERVRQRCERHVWAAERGMGECGKTDSLQLIKELLDRQSAHKEYLRSIICSDTLMTSIIPLKTWADLQSRVNAEREVYRAYIQLELSKYYNLIELDPIGNKDYLKALREKNKKLVEQCTEDEVKRHWEARDLTPEEFAELKTRTLLTAADTYAVQKHEIFGRYGLISEEIIKADIEGMYPAMRTLYNITDGFDFLEGRDCPRGTSVANRIEALENVQYDKLLGKKTVFLPDFAKGSDRTCKAKLLRDINLLELVEELKNRIFSSKSEVLQNFLTHCKEYAPEFERHLHRAC